MSAAFLIVGHELMTSGESHLHAIKILELTPRKFDDLKFTSPLHFLHITAEDIVENTVANSKMQ